MVIGLITRRLEKASLRATLLALMTVSGSSSLFAAPTSQIFEVTFTLEARLLDAGFERYTAARQREDEARAELRKLSETMDGALANREVSLDRLRDLDMELASARETAATRSGESAELRREIFVQMERLEELGHEIQRQRDRMLVVTEDLDGFWLIEITDHGSGLLELRLDGTLVSRSYRLNNGAQGSVRGTYTNHRLLLDRIDTIRGFESTLEGRHDTESGELRGSWQAQEISDGRSAYGDWAARKLAPGEDGDDR